MDKVVALLAGAPGFAARHWRALAGLLVALLICLAFALTWRSGHAAGVRDEKAGEAARIERAKADNLKRAKAAEGITAKAATGLGKERVRIRTVTQTLLKEVPVYVTPVADDRCVVPLGFVQLHDAAAAGRAPAVSAAAGRPVDAPSGVPLSAVGAVVVENYGVAYDWRAEALTWRSWYAEQKAAWER